MNSQSHFAWVDGDFIAIDHARIYLLDAARFGPPLQSLVMRCHQTARGSVLFRSQAQIGHFLRRLEAQQLSYEIDAAQLSTAIQRSLLLNNLLQGYVRIAVYNELRLPLRATDFRAIMVITVQSTPFIHTATVHERPHEAVYLAVDGHLFTNRRQHSDGRIGLDTVRKLLGDDGIHVIETELTQSRWQSASEAFVFRPNAAPTPIQAIDCPQMPLAATGQLTQHLQALFQQVIGGEHRRSPGWLDYVVADPMTC